MTTATVKYISNGYIVTGSNFPPSVPQPLYATTIPEVVYWLGRIYDPIVQTSSLEGQVTAFESLLFQVRELLEDRPSEPTPQLIENSDLLLGQLANVDQVASGGYLVTQVPSPTGTGNRQTIETFTTTMDGVSDLLTEIFTPPVDTGSDSLRT